MVLQCLPGVMHFGGASSEQGAAGKRVFSGRDPASQRVSGVVLELFRAEETWTNGHVPSALKITLSPPIFRLPNSLA